MYTVLVAEDDVYLRDAYVIILKSAGYSVEGVENGKLALESIEKSPPDVLLLDMLMPIMSGMELLETLSAKGLLADLKVIAFTNLSDKTTVERLKGYKVDKYLLKSSVMPGELVKHIQETINNKETSL